MTSFARTSVSLNTRSIEVKLVVPKVGHADGLMTLESAALSAAELLSSAPLEGDVTVLGCYECCRFAYELAHRLAAQEMSVARVILLGPAGDPAAAVLLAQHGEVDEDAASLKLANNAYRMFNARLPLHCLAVSAEDADSFVKDWEPLRSANCSATLHRVTLAAVAEEVFNLLTGAPELRQVTAPKYRPGVELRRGALRTSVFVFPGAGDTAISLLPILAAVPAGWSVYGLHSRGFEDVYLPYPTPESAVAAFADETLRLAPSGPLHFLGHSLGGLLACMTAQALEERGRSVASVMIVDSELPQSPPKWEYTDVEVLREYLTILGQAAHAQIPVTAEELAMYGSGEMMNHLHSAMVSVGLVSRRSSPESFLNAYRLFASSIRWKIDKEDLVKFKGTARVVLAKDTSPPETALRRVADWKVLLPQSAAVAVAGNHMSILKEPLCASVVEHWRRLLEAMSH